MIAGIDGGGTGTRLLLRDEENRPVKELRFGPFNITAIGEERFRALLREMAAAVDFREVGRLCIGAAGASYQGLEEIIRRELTGFGGQLRLVTDFETALRGAMEGPGCVLIAGTGAVGFGVGQAGESVRVGGWGHLIDDGGSGYALGRDALSLAMQTLDGRAQAQALTRAVLADTGSASAAELVTYVYRGSGGKADVARVAETVLRCAAAGDSHSLAILQNGAAELKQIVLALGQRLGMPRPRLALLGGLLTHDNVYRALVTETLADCACLVPPQHDGAWGAAQLAWEMGSSSVVNGSQKGR